MGGYSGGEIASTYAVDEIKEYLASLQTVGQQDLCDAIIHANERIANRVAHEERLAGMGTTAVVTAINGNQLYWEVLVIVVCMYIEMVFTTNYYRSFYGTRIISCWRDYKG